VKNSKHVESNFVKDLVESKCILMPVTYFLLQEEDACVHLCQMPLSIEKTTSSEHDGSK